MKILLAVSLPQSQAICGNLFVNTSREGIASLWQATWQVEGSVDYDSHEPFPPQSASSLSANELLGSEKLVIEAEAIRLAEIDQSEGIKDRVTTSRRLWTLFARLSTIFVPGFALSWVGIHQPEARLAWREKTALCLLVVLMSATMLFFIMGLSITLCPNQQIMTIQEVEAQPKNRPHIMIHGTIYDATPLLDHHIENGALPRHIEEWAGRDASSLFPKPSIVRMLREELIKGVGHRLFKRSSSDVISGESSGSTAYTRRHKKKRKPKPLKKVAVLADRDSTESGRTITPTRDQSKIPRRKIPLRRGHAKPKTRVSPTHRIQYMHSMDSLGIMISLPKQYYVGIPHRILYDGFTSSKAKVSIFNAVYDISSLVGKWGKLSPEAVEALSAPWGVDKSGEFKYPHATRDIEILRDYFIGVLDERNSFNCRLGNYLLVGSAGIIALVMLVKFLAALQLGSKKEPEELDKFVVMLVPCFTENEESLRKTIDSLAVLHYDDRRKLLFIVADGIAVGKSNDRATPHIVLDILGVEATCDPPAKACEAVGEGLRSLNYAKVYSGLYECGGRRVPYIVVIKVGLPEEQYLKGNRGKRDSQMLLLRFLSRIYYDEPMSPLELEVYEHLKFAIGVDPSYYEYLLMIDADTEAMPDALNRMISHCVHDAKVVGICGETRLANEKRSIITMIQVYEYYISHHLSKAFESLFGVVTCLPGCFCLYRLRSVSSKTPVLLHRDVLSDYSETDVSTLHRKNLLALGEDRYLTTIMLKHFSSHRTKFTSDAACKTIAPDRWAVLLSQRRRWINSTIHNLFELLFLPNMCGFGCFSMRFVILMDLYATFLMPASVVYLGYLIYQAIQTKFAPMVSLGLIALVYGMQIFIFMLKREWKHIGWMVIHMFAIPVFGIIIPIYAFWHFDDFSWGATRSTVVHKNISDAPKKDKKFLKLVERKRWDDHMWDMKSSIPVQPDSNRGSGR
jgi:chitin synthase